MSTCSVLRRQRTRRIQRQIRTLSVFILIWAAITAWFLWDWEQNKHAVESLNFHPQVVQAGDTLWSLAEKANLDIDTRTLVLKMMDYNHLTDPTIRTGQVIYAPISSNQSTAQLTRN